MIRNQFSMNRQFAESGAVFLFGVDMLNARILHTLKINFPVESADEERNPPVPSAVALHFADQIQVLDRIDSGTGNIHRQFAVFLFRMAKRGVDRDFNAVRSCLEELLHIRAEPGEHILGVPDCPTVDADCAESVDRINVQENDILLEKRLVEFKIAAPGPVEVAHPLNEIFVHGNIGIRDDARIEKRGIIVARNTGGNRRKARLAGRKSPFGS